CSFRKRTCAARRGTFMRDSLTRVIPMGLRGLRCCCLFGFALLPLAISLSYAQNPPTTTGQSPVIKSEVRIVLVDVVVTQGGGEPVAGLNKEDFQVSED